MNITLILTLALKIQPKTKLFIFFTIIFIFSMKMQQRLTIIKPIEVDIQADYRNYWLSNTEKDGGVIHQNPNRWYTIMHK